MVVFDSRGRRLSLLVAVAFCHRCNHAGAGKRQPDDRRRTSSGPQRSQERDSVARRDAHALNTAATALRGAISQPQPCASSIWCGPLWDCSPKWSCPTARSRKHRVVTTARRLGRTRYAAATHAYTQVPREDPLDRHDPVYLPGILPDPHLRRQDREVERPLLLDACDLSFQ